MWPTQNLIPELPCSHPAICCLIWCLYELCVVCNRDEGKLYPEQYPMLSYTSYPNPISSCSTTSLHSDPSIKKKPICDSMKYCRKKTDFYCSSYRVGVSPDFHWAWIHRSEDWNLVLYNTHGGWLYFCALCHP